MPKKKKGQQNEQQEINEALKATLKAAKAELEKRQTALQRARKKAGEVASPFLMWAMEMGVGGSRDRIDTLTKLLNSKRPVSDDVRKSWKKSLKTEQKNYKTRSAEYKKAKEKAALMARLEEAVKKQQELVNLWQEQVDKATMDEWEVVEYVPQTKAGAEYPTMEEIEAVVKEVMPEFFDKSVEKAAEEPQPMKSEEVAEMPEFFDKSVEKAAEEPQPMKSEEVAEMPEFFDKSVEKAAEEPQPMKSEEVAEMPEFFDKSVEKAAEEPQPMKSEEVAEMPEFSDKSVEKAAEEPQPTQPEEAAEDEIPTLEVIEAQAAANANKPKDLDAAEPFNEFSFEDVTPEPEERLEAAQPAMPEEAAEDELPSREVVEAQAAANANKPKDLDAAEPFNEFSFEDVTPEPEERLEAAPKAEKSSEQLAAEKAAEEARKQKEAEEAEKQKAAAEAEAQKQKEAEEAEKQKAAAEAEAQKQKAAEEAEKQKAAAEARKQKEAEEKERAMQWDIDNAMDDIIKDQTDIMYNIIKEKDHVNGKAVDSLEDNMKAFAKNKDKHDSPEFSMMRDALEDLNIQKCVDEIRVKRVLKRGDLSTVQKYQEKLQKAREATQAYIDKKQGEFFSGTLGLGSGGSGLSRAQNTMEQLDKMMVCLDSIVENRKNIVEVADYKYHVGGSTRNLNLKELEKVVADKRPRPAKKQAVKKSEKKDVKKGKKI